MNKLMIFSFVLSVFVSCSNASERVLINEINSNWNKNKVQSFQFHINDAQVAKNIIFVVRNNNDYPYSNLRVISELRELKQKPVKADTLNYILAKPNGEWIGSGFGGIKETLFQYKINYKFPKNGDYIISIKQAMRQDNLKGIEDFGVKLENAKP